MKAKNYVLTFVLVLLCVLCMPKAAMAEGGSCGPNATWTYAGGELTIKGNGKVDSNPWEKNSYVKNITNVVVEEGITEFSKMEMFSKCTNLEKVTLPNSLTNIGYTTFQGCKALKSIVIPKNVTEASAGNTFENSGLTTVTFAEGATKVPTQLFEDCATLEKVNLPQSIKELGDSAFENCTSLKEITLPEGLVDIGYTTFKGCKSLTSIVIPKNVTEASAGNTFENSGLTTVTFAEGATKIPTQLFEDCTTLEKVNLPQTLKEIEDSAFENCTGLTKITLPWYLEKVGFYAFKGCTNLKEITIYQKAKVDSFAFKNLTGLKIYGKAGSEAQKIAKSSGFIFATCKIPALKGITYTKGNLKYKVVTDYIGGKGTVMVTGMKKNASSVTIPKTVKLESYNYKVVKINSKAFYKKSKIKKVTIKSTTITSIGKNAFKGINKKATFKVPKSKYTKYKRLLTSTTGFAKKTMKVRK